MWLQEEIVAVQCLPGFAFVRTTFQHWGRAFIKCIGLLTNLPVAHWLSADPDHGAPYIPLRGMAYWNGVRMFRTKISKPYPINFAIPVALVVQTSLQMAQLARSLGLEIPMLAREYDVIDVQPPGHH